VIAQAGSLEFAQARIQARHGSRPDEVAWRRLEVIREFGAMLETARSTALRPWLVGVTSESSLHAIDAALRAHWRALVTDVAAWMPMPWQDSLRWCATLVDLPVVQHLMRGGERWPWMEADPVYREALDDLQEGARLRDGKSSLARLARDAGEPERILDAWRARWLAVTPRAIGVEAGSALAVVEIAFLRHLEAFGAAQAGDGWPLRRALQSRLQLAFRRVVLEPAAAFVFLALESLDAERLRGELLRRAAFPRLVVA
jgi:hypothetical protein